MVQRKSLIDGSEFALTVMEDPESAEKYLSSAQSITTSLDKHWNPEKGFIVSTLESFRVRWGIDSSVILAVNMCDIEGVNASFGVTDDRVMASIPHIVNTFSDMYVINRHSFGLSLGASLGRYPEDVYDGHGASRGNPWPMLTLSLSEYYYKLVMYYRLHDEVSVTEGNLGFFDFIGIHNVTAGVKYDLNTYQAQDVMDRLMELADMSIRRVKFHSDNDRLSEQINRDTGFSQGARDKTWAYAIVFNLNNLRNLFL